MTNPVKGPFRPGVVWAIVWLHIGALAGLVCAVWSCFTVGVSATVWVMALGLYVANFIGISVGYHRLWTHQAFKCRRWVQYTLAVLGGLAAEGPLAVPPEVQKRYRGWVKDHLQHHASTDRDYDPHSPRQWGFFWAHMGWLFFETVPPPGWRNTTRLDNDPVVRWQYRWYWYIAVAGFVVPGLVALAVGGWMAGLQGVLIAGFLRTVAHLHVTWCVNSVAHLWGTRATSSAGVPYTDDDSRNNWVLALFSGGEGWHGYHHADPNSYQLGVKWWHFDPGKWFINILRWTRLAWDGRRFARS